MINFFRVKFNVNVVLLVLMVLSCGTLSGQSKIQTFYSDSLLKDDLDSLHKTILETHVDPYIFCTQEEFERAFEEAYSKCSTGLSLKEFAPVVGSTLQVMRDSHTCLNYPYMEDLILRNGGRKLMFRITGNNDGIFVEDDILEELIPGSKIISINGSEIEQLHKRFLAYSSIEGKSEEGFHRIANALLGSVGAFEIDIRNKNIIEVIPPGIDTIQKIQYPGLKKKELRVFYRLWHNYHGESSNHRIFDLEITEDPDMAILKVESFSEGSANAYNRFLKKSFEKIHAEGISNLVLDLRDNTGGQSVRMEKLLAYLSSNQPSVPHNIIAKQSPLARQRVRHIYRGINKFMINHFFGGNEEVLAFRNMMKLKDGEQDTLYFKVPEKINSKLRYDGKCYLLMNGMSASASVNFAAAFKRLGRGPVVGESCLGPMSGTWGNPSIYKLKNTGLELFISTIRFNADGTFQYEPEPIHPDYDVQTSPTDLFNKKDSQIEFVRQMILNPSPR